MISQKKWQELTAQMQALGIREDDLTEQFVRASGPGGQKVNKTSTCVSLRHGPSGIEVKCSKERSQALNRFLARRLVVEKLEERMRGEQSAKQQAIAKLRRQKRRRSARAKAKLLEDKRHQSKKKKMRAKRIDSD